MKVVSHGILPGSELCFYTASTLAHSMYFYPLCTGHYLCDSSYVVERQRYDSFLVMYVREGGGWLECNGTRTRLRAGSAALVDCYEQHRYYTDSGWDIYWLHFDGAASRQYFRLITRGSCVLTPVVPYPVELRLKKLFESFGHGAPVNEAVLSKQITDLLTELVLCANAADSPEGSTGAVEEALAFISENAQGVITVEQLAKRTSLSPFYFTRLFKKETGFTPHEYIVRVRLDRARFLLKTTSSTVKEIAFRCGFNSECSFCVAFKKATALTPTAYRRDKDML